MIYNKSGLRVKNILGKKKCKCGRRVMIKRNSDGSLPSENIECLTCKTYGLEESKRLFIENFVNTKSNGKTQFKINVGSLPERKK